MNLSDEATLFLTTGDKDCLNIEASERRYSVRDMCCNQFGERDEIQAIIDKLRADVAERDERIETLEGIVAKQDVALTNFVNDGVSRDE